MKLNVQGFSLVETLNEIQVKFNCSKILKEIL